MKYILKNFYYGKCKTLLEKINKLKDVLYS